MKSLKESVNETYEHKNQKSENFTHQNGPVICPNWTTFFHYEGSFLTGVISNPFIFVLPLFQWQLSPTLNRICIFSAFAAKWGYPISGCDLLRSEYVCFILFKHIRRTCHCSITSKPTRSMDFSLWGRCPLPDQRSMGKARDLKMIIDIGNRSFPFLKLVMLFLLLPSISKTSFIRGHFF